MERKVGFGGGVKEGCVEYKEDGVSRVVAKLECGDDRRLLTNLNSSKKTENHRRGALLSSSFCDEMLELLLFTIKDLRKSLKDQGCNLMIRFGSAESVIQELITEVVTHEVKATTIFAEEEVEYNLCGMMDIVKETLTTASTAEAGPRIVIWNTPFYDIKNLKDLPASHRDFKKLKLPVVVPLFPEKLPDLEIDLAWGPLPTLKDLKKFLDDHPVELKNKWTSTKKVSVQNSLQKYQVAAPVHLIEGLEISKSGKSNKKNSNYKHAQTRRPKTSVFLTQQGNMVGGGTNLVLNGLAAYLRYLEGTSRDDWQEYVVSHQSDLC
ncbi:unnamed protein product [Ilex paraguariensis]|uniref:Uncharacterized protein n=1 Tax=Ilex paraguariensis TaxID=185542 RepID=A0ABC8SV39_9AQUA